jgi:hypothetical protein
MKKDSFGMDDAPTSPTKSIFSSGGFDSNYENDQVPELNPMLIA